MSTDEMAQVFKYLSAIAREVGEFRQEFNGFRNDMNTFRDEMYKFRNETNGRLDKIEGRLSGVEREQRETRRFMDRVHGLLLVSRSEADELRERIEVLEEKKA
ncbi:MAG TPA: hypothetical protein VK422_15535 [Pyrinomonadaceae bacterium]|nr:hypothetical protein [Pyrinomonadaceae bacterium]